MKQPNHEKVVEVNGVTKAFKGVVAVNDVSLNIYRGEFVALLGPNGAGKTTLVEIIEGLQKPDSGEIRILGNQWSKDDRYLRTKLSLVLQESLFINKLRVDETLNLFGSFYKKNRTRTEEILKLVELTAKRKALIETLSGGQRQRLALGVALVNKPEIMILDEPTTGLDPGIRRGTWEILRKLNKEEGTTLILTTHYMDEAEYLCDRICLMHQGNILSDGSLDNLLAKFAEGEVVEYKVNENYESKVIKCLPNILNYNYDNKTNKVVILVKNVAEFLADFFETIKTQKIKITELVARKKTLDDIFVSMAGREFNE